MNSVFLRRTGNYQMCVAPTRSKYFWNNWAPSHISEILKLADLFGWCDYFGCFGLPSPLKSMYKQTS